MDLWSIPVIDQHAHNLLKPEISAAYPYGAAFTEGHDSEIVNYHVRHTLSYRRSLRDMAALLGCSSHEEAILAQRANLGLETLTQLCFSQAKLDMILLDDGFLPGDILPLAWHQQFVPIKRLLRLEMLAEDLLMQADSFDTFLACFLQEIDPPPVGVVGFKSIAAYRTGLDIQAVSDEAAESNFYTLKQMAQGQRVRLANKPLIDFLLIQALEVAAKHQYPIQFHTGFGDPDLDLRTANPLCLRPLLENPLYRQAKFVLLHASYPFVREAGYLASVYPQVYVDFGLAVPLLSVSGMRDAVRMLLELAPTSKLMYSSDAHFIPDLYYLGAKWGREVLGNILQQAVKDSDLTYPEADEIAIAILSGNARTLYQL